MTHALTPIPCPCCGRSVDAPSLEMIIDQYGATEKESAILRAVWSGRGFIVATDRIISAMYADDPSGGPLNAYAAFKIAMCRLRKKLAGSGVGIKSGGYGSGYRLITGEQHGLTQQGVPDRQSRARPGNAKVQRGKSGRDVLDRDDGKLARQGVRRTSRPHRMAQHRDLE